MKCTTIKSLAIILSIFLTISTLTGCDTCGSGEETPPYTNPVLEEVEDILLEKGFVWVDGKIGIPSIAGRYAWEDEEEKGVVIISQEDEKLTWNETFWAKNGDYEVVDISIQGWISWSEGTGTLWLEFPPDEEHDTYRVFSIGNITLVENNIVLNETIRILLYENGDLNVRTGEGEFVFYRQSGGGGD